MKHKEVTSLYIQAPMYVTLKRKTVKDRKMPINMNNYGNTNSFLNNEAKRAYLEAVREQIEGLVIQTPVKVSYRVVKGSKRRLDKMNVVSVVSKYLFDALTELGVWGDDSDEFIKQELIMPTMYEKGKFYVQINITSLSI